MPPEAETDALVTSVGVVHESTHPIHGAATEEDHPLTSSDRSGRHLCLQCRKRFTESRSLARHLRDSCKYNKLPRERYRCDWCDLSFGRNDILHRHVQEVHLLQGNEKRMSKTCREASSILYGESSVERLEGGTSRDFVKEEAVYDTPSATIGQLTRPGNDPEYFQTSRPFISNEPGSTPNEESQYSRDVVDTLFDVSAISLSGIPDANINDIELSAAIAWQLVSALDIVEDFIARGDEKLGRTMQRASMDGFDIEDWIELSFLRDHSEPCEGQ